MKLSWFCVILLLGFVAIFSVQNAGVMTVRFLVWEVALSAALAIQLSALLGALVGLVVGVYSRRRSSREHRAVSPQLDRDPPAPLP